LGQTHVKWGNYIGDDAKVLFRIDKQEAEEKHWHMSTDRQSIFYPDFSPQINVWEFLGRLEKGERLVVKITPGHSESSTAIFDIRGLSNSANIISEECLFRERNEIAQLEAAVKFLRGKDSKLYEKLNDYARQIVALDNEKENLKKEFAELSDTNSNRAINEGRISLLKKRILNINKTISDLNKVSGSNMEESENLSQQIDSKNNLIAELTKKLKL
jgi:hypothetical protein